MKFIKKFGQIGKNDANIAGGKGASLGEMTKAGIAVPEGFVVLADAFNYFLEKEELFVEVEAELNKINFEDPNSVEETSERLRGLIERVEMPEEIKTEVTKGYDRLRKAAPATPEQAHACDGGRVNNSYYWVAVRSSATAEDSNTASWAGELESYLFTNGQSLIANVKRCWSSLFTPRALFYRHEKGMIAIHVAVAVVVQRMINSNVSGITFTVHPVTKDPNQMIIEAAWGLGEAIVGGMVTPDDYIVAKRQVTSNKVTSNMEILNIIVNEQKIMIVAKKDGGTQEVETSRHTRGKQKLTGEQILEIAQICQQIEDHYGFPCDIEWALEAQKSKGKTKKSKFYIVQSRPITTL